METKRVLRSYFLLLIYLLVISHQAIFHGHPSESGDLDLLKPAHEHEGFANGHHEHDFHIGIVHYLKHLFEKLDHAEDFAQEHMVAIAPVIDKKISSTQFVPFVLSCFQKDENLDIGELKEKLKPPDSSFKQKLYFYTDTPLRAPPTV